MRTKHFLLLGGLIGGAAILPGPAAAMMAGASDGKGGLIFQTLPQAQTGAAAALPSAVPPRGMWEVTSNGELTPERVPTMPALNLSEGGAASLPPALALRGLPEVTSNGELTPERMPGIRG